MTFLNQPILWLLFAAAIPIIIHLLNRRRHRTVKWAAMSFILKATRESRGKKKLKHLIILTARTLALAALVIAIAQPLVGGFLGWGGSKLDTVVLVLDRSLSMESETGLDGISKREEAISQVQSTLKELGNPTLILIDSASGDTQEIQDPETLSIISQAAASDTKADIPSLVDSAVNHVLANSTGKTEIWVASDLQGTNWQADSTRWEMVQSGVANSKQKPKIRVLALTAKQPDNKSVSINEVKRRGNTILLDFNISRVDATKEALIDASIFLNGNEYKVEKYSLDGQTITLQESLDLTNEPISGFGYISITPDGNNRDNNAFFAYGEATPSNTLIVSEGGESTDSLEKASALPGFEHQNAEIIEPHQLDSGKLQKTSMVVWQAPLPKDNDASILSRYIEQGGSVIFFPPSEDSENQFLGISWGEMQESNRGEYFIISEWNEEEGPQRNYNNGENVPLEQLHAIQRRQILGDISHLASWDNSSTAMGRVIEGQGTAYFINTLPDRRWSDLDTGGIIVPVFQNMLELGNKRFGSSYFSETGRNSPIASDANEIISVIDNSSVNERYSIQKDGVDSQPLYLAGVKRIGERILATNRPESEDDWTVLQEKELDTIFKDTDYSLFSNSGEESASTAERIWQLFLIAALIFLIIEAILCLNKKTKTVKTTSDQAKTLKRANA